MGTQAIIYLSGFVFGLVSGIAVAAILLRRWANARLAEQQVMMAQLAMELDAARHRIVALESTRLQRVAEKVWLQ